MINEKLLALDGLKKGYADSSHVKEYLSAIKSDITTEQMFEEDILKNVTVTPSELNKGVNEKEITFRIKWLYAPDKDSLNYYKTAIKKGISFDSLFQEQLKDSVFADQRSLEKDKFQFRIENPEMFSKVDSMSPDEVSDPIEGHDGWYIVKVINIKRNVITTVTQQNKELYDVKTALTMSKSDSISDKYVRNLMLAHNPVIQGKVFDILRSYMGTYVLNAKKFKLLETG